MNLCDLYFRHLVRDAAKRAKASDPTFDINEHILIKNIDDHELIFNDQDILPGQLAFVYNKSIQHFLDVVNHKVVSVRYEQVWLS